MENIYQSKKVYEKIPKSTQIYSQWDKTIIWDYPEVNCVFDNSLTDEYFTWRNKLENNKFPVRYPATFNHRHKCIGMYLEGKCDPKDKSTFLDYITGRKECYIPTYCELVKKTNKFKLLQSQLHKEINLLIVEVDGPHEESLEYYKKKYGVDDDFIVYNTMLMTKENNKIMLNDPKHPYGHGYALALALFETDKLWIE